MDADEDAIFDDPSFWDQVAQTIPESATSVQKGFQLPAVGPSDSEKGFHLNNDNVPILPWTKDLNPEQRRAVQSDPNIPLLVLAGAGSGKTLTMVRRVRYLLERTGCKPWEVLAVTFTRNAADEMRQRLAKEIGNWAAQRLTISTFHAFCLKVCRDHPAPAGRAPGFGVCSGREQAGAAAGALRRHDRAHGRDTSSPDYEKELMERSKRFLKYILKLKMEGKTCRDAKGQAQEMFQLYEEQMEAQNALDFADLVNKALQVLLCDAGALASYAGRAKYILVDEFQDTSQLQYQVVSLLGKHGRVTVVGDDDQSIYSFQGAHVGNFDLFQKDFNRIRPVQVIRLQQNYRSSSNIVEASNAVIQVNKARVAKTCWSDRGAGPRVTVVECRNRKCEMAFLLDEIIKKELAGRRLGEMAIIYRRNATGYGEVLPALKAKGVPATTTFTYRTSEIAEVIALLRLAVNMKDDGACRRVIQALRLKLHQATINLIENKTKRGTSMVDAIHAIEAEPGLLESLEPAEEGRGRRFKKQCHQRRELGRFTDAVHTMTSRISELSLIEFIKRVLELCPHLRQQINRRPAPGQGKSLPQALLSEAEAYLSKEEEEVGRQLPEDEGTREETTVDARIRRVKGFLDHISMSLEEEQEFRRSKSKKDPSNKKKKRKRPRPGDKRLKWGRFNDGDSDEDEEDTRDAVWCGTAHQAKGLEWPVVFVCRANEEDFPLLPPAAATADDPVAAAAAAAFEEEERRVAYVALSRARDELHLSYVLELEPGRAAPRRSRFLDALPPRLVEARRKYDVAVAAAAAACAPSSSSLGGGCSGGGDGDDPGPVGDSALVSTQSDWRQFVANPQKEFGRNVVKKFMSASSTAGNRNGTKVTAGSSSHISHSLALPHKTANGDMNNEAAPHNDGLLLPTATTKKTLQQWSPATASLKVTKPQHECMRSWPKNREQMKDGKQLTTKHSNNGVHNQGQIHNEKEGGIATEDSNAVTRESNPAEGEAEDKERQCQPNLAQRMMVMNGNEEQVQHNSMHRNTSMAKSQKSCPSAILAASLPSSSKNSSLINQFLRLRQGNAAVQDPQQQQKGGGGTFSEEINDKKTDHDYNDEDDDFVPRKKKSTKMKKKKPKSRV